MFKKNKFLVILIALLLVSSVALVNAEDDDDEDDEEESTSSSTSKAVVDTRVSTETIIIKDSDGDGLTDANDPHPDIAEIYIVQDENRNGIVDNFENEKK